MNNGHKERASKLLRELQLEIKWIRDCEREKGEEDILLGVEYHLGEAIHNLKQLLPANEQ